MKSLAQRRNDLITILFLPALFSFVMAGIAAACYPKRCPANQVDVPPPEIVLPALLGVLLAQLASTKGIVGRAELPGRWADILNIGLPGGAVVALVAGFLAREPDRAATACGVHMMCHTALLGMVALSRVMKVPRQTEPNENTVPHDPDQETARERERLMMERDEQINAVVNSGRDPTLIVAEVQQIQEEYARRLGRREAA